MQSPDPYHLHPELRGKIRDPLTSFFRTFQPADIDAHMRENGRDDDWRYSDEVRERMRHAFLSPCFGRDLWVFGYGSLMWDPAFRFCEVRVGSVQGYARSFCLKDSGGPRGSLERPGLMAGLDTGAGCTGIVFRIEARLTERESEVIWRREAIASAYRPTMVDVVTAAGTVRALTFVANHDSPVIFPNLPRTEQVEYLATGEGWQGTSRQYLEGIASQLDALGIKDEIVAGLLAEVQDYARKRQEKVNGG